MSYEDQTLNYSLFDQLLVDYLSHEGFLKGDTNNKFADEYEKYKEKLETLNKIRECVQEGKIQIAIDLTKSVNASVLNDPKLLFKLYKQQFLEYIRIGDIDSALSYAKFQLAPFALDAFPEAYPQFKHALMALLYDLGDLSSPVATEWSTEERTTLSSTLYSSLLSALGTHETQFTFLIRYLMITHFHYHALQGSESPLKQIEKLILPDTGAPAPPMSPLPPSTSGPDSIKINDNDVQQLVQTVQISQQQAIDSLKRAKGIAKDALKHELAKMKLNSDLLVNLTIEYCQHRGLIGLDKSNLSQREQKTVAENSEKVEKLRSVRKFATPGHTSELLNLANDLDPSFPSWAPMLYFDLKQCEYVDSINSRDFAKAMDIIRGCLAPMSLKHPELAPKVLESAVLLAFNGEPPPLPLLSLSPSHLAGPLYTALGQKSGLAEPELISILKYLLHVHTLWFATMGSRDGFEGFFNLEELKTADVPQGDSKPQETKPEKKEIEITDDAISTLMEIMAISKGEAMSLLQAYDGNMENVLASWMT